MTEKFPHPISLAPMMKRTDRHFRYFLRQISRRTLLYTEMVNTQAILNHDPERIIGFNESEHPVALQIGGSDISELVACAQIAEEMGYDEVNLNVGCPSNRVKKGRFGACLMKEPDVVANSVQAMRDAVDIEVTVKHRIGVDDIDTYEDMLNFVDRVSQTGCKRFTVHARKAWLQGLSPAENRDIPPLRHHEIHRLKQERPNLIIETNGGITTLDEAEEHLQHVDAVMIGRAAYETPYIFADVDRRFYGDNTPVPSRHDVIRNLFDYADYWTKERGHKLNYITRHLLHMFDGQQGARRWRQHLSEEAYKDHADSRTLQEALSFVSEEPAKVSA